MWYVSPTKPLGYRSPFWAFLYKKICPDLVQWTQSILFLTAAALWKWEATGPDLPVSWPAESAPDICAGGPISPPRFPPALASTCSTAVAGLPRGKRVVSGCHTQCTNMAHVQNNISSRGKWKHRTAFCQGGSKAEGRGGKVWGK